MSVRLLLTGAMVFAAAHFAQSGRAANLPEGEGRDLVEAICTGCHQTNQILRSSGYTAEGWQALTATMIDLSGGPEEQQQIVAYLAVNFPPNDRRAPTLISGDARIEFTEWVAPTLGQRARDPVEAADGSIWWVGQWGNVLGQIDPATGKMTEYPLPAEARPHSVTLDRDGNPWYTGNGNGTIGKLDIATGEITVFPMPDSAARDPHTAEFDDDGILWFTLQRSNMVGRLDPATGDVKLVSMKAPGARPYGIKIDADGVPWVACNGSNWAGSDGTIPRPARSTNGRRRAARTRIPMRSPSSTASFGTTSRANGQTHWSASIRAIRPSKAGQSLREASMLALSAICGLPPTATS
jgi:virginiamycin B lyase